MASTDAAMMKLVRSKIARRSVDSSGLNIRCSHGSVNLVGVIRTIRSSPEIDLRKEMELITTVLRTIPGVRDVVWDVTQRT
jgi:hypothetical protein